MVTTENEGSDLIDPLVDYSCLSLLSRSLNLSSSSSTPNSSIFDSIHAHLKARVLSSPDKMFKQATTILEGSLDLSEAEKTQTVFTENEKVPRERRPALGLRRAKFSVKPMPSQPAVDLEPSIDFDKLTDPEEFFAAFERMENAKKEVQRLKGGPLIDLDLNRGPLAPRRRRPSLLGRSATYTHRPYPSGSTADVDETLLPSQEPIDDDILRPTHYDVVPGATAVDSSSIMRVSDSKATTTSKISELDELLSSNYEGLDEDGVQNLLRDKLQIKSVDIGKASLPDWRVPLHESLTSSSALPKTNDTVFCLSGGNKAVSGKNKQSPANSRSPLASISILNRHIAKRTPSNDLFSCLHFDSSPKKTTSPSSEFEKRVDQVGKSDSVGAVKNLYKFRRSPAHGEEDTAVAGDDTFVSVAKDINLNNEPKDKEVVVGKHDQIGSREDSHEFRRSPAHEEESILVSDIGEPENQENEVAAAQESVRHQLNFEGLMETSNLNEVEKGGVSEPSNTGNHQAFVAVEKGGVSEPSNTGNHPVEELVEQETVGSSKRKLKRKGKSKAPSKAAVSKRTQANTSQSDDPVSGEIRDKRRRVEGARPELSKGERRSSLYCAGTRWDAGVRRSTRIRMRPLEFWKGERFLYGRVHESLVTVIGVKYASPSKEAEGPGVKVKSFVSDRYKDLVELASLH